MNKKRRDVSGIFAQIGVWLIIGAVVALIITTMLYGSKQSMIYQEKTQTIDTIEEILADQLEIENPELDIKVTISVEQD